jgi:ribonuclease-3
MAHLNQDSGSESALEIAEVGGPNSALEGRIGYTFRSKALLQAALTHPSYNNVKARTGEVVTDNQRLEFLGDAVLDLVVGEQLFRADPLADPGTLTQRRIAIVTERSLARRGTALGLGEVLRFGPGQDRTRFLERPSVLADAFEALLGALYLDGGLEAVSLVIERVLGDELRARPNVATLKSPKAALQELAQGRWGATPRYRVVATSPCYEVEVCAGSHVQSSGRGNTRREAEERAAETALADLAAPQKSKEE